MSAPISARRHYLLYGQVQGVGFRYRAQYAANLLGLTGWAANLWDGSVEMEAQGSPQALDQFLPLITKSSNWIEIEHFLVEDLAPLPPTAERGFRIRY